MKRLLHNVRLRVVDILGLDRMGKKYHMLTISYVFLMFYTTLEGVFVNTLLYRVSGGGMLSVIVYRGITYISSGILMHAAAYITQKKSPVMTARLGAMGYLAMYAILFVWMEDMARFQYVLAALAGASGCFYWTGHNVLVSHYTTQKNRDAGISILGVIQGIMTLCIPLVSGFVIKLMPEISGYRVLFGVAIVSVLVQLVVISRFHPIEQLRHRSELRLALKLLFRKAEYKLMLVYDFFRGIRDGTFAFILNMLLFEIITDESVVGINTFLTGIMAITGSWVYGKLVGPGRRIRYSLICVTALMIFCGALYWNMSAAVVMTFTVANAFLQLFLLYSYNNTTYDVISRNQLARKCSAEMFAIREAPIMLGRVLGLWLTTQVPPTRQGYVVVMLLLTLLQYLGVLFMKLTLGQLGRKKKPEPPAQPAPAEG